MLAVKGLIKTFQSGGAEVHAVDGVSFEVGDGQFVSIIGKSGSGKNTLLSLLGALEKPTFGSIIVVTHDLSIAGKTDKTFRLQDGELVNG
jgi:putative ABC transport system ATP-binding protein